MEFENISKTWKRSLESTTKNHEKVYLWNKCEALRLCCLLTHWPAWRASTYSTFRCSSGTKVFIVTLSFSLFVLSGVPQSGAHQMPSFQETQAVNVSYMFREPVFSNKLLFARLPNRLFTEVTNDLYISQQVLNGIGYSQCWCNQFFFSYIKNTLWKRLHKRLSPIILLALGLQCDVQSNKHELNI